MFATSSLAKRIERAEVALVADAVAACARRVPSTQLIDRRVAGGIAAYIEPGCPFNKIAGLGFDGLPSDEDFASVEREFAARSSPLQAEISTLAEPAVAKRLTERGYALVGFENVLGLNLRQWSDADRSSDIDVRPTASGEGPIWLSTVTDGFLHADAFDGPPSHETFARESLERVFNDMLNASGLERYLALRDGAVAGGASLRIHDGIATLCGAATLPEHRRRGVQTALLRERLRIAVERGCDTAVVTTQPASKSQSNVQRAGFALLYARAVLVREWAG